MKKKALALVMVVLTAIMMIGCNKTGISLLDEIQKVYAWEAIDSKADFAVEVAAGGETIKLDGDITAYMNIADEVVEGAITLNKLEAGGETIDLKTGDSAIAPIKVLSVGDKTYISKSYIENILGIAGVAPSKGLSSITSEYIGLQSPQSEMSKANITKYMDLMKNLDVDFNVTQKDRTYSVELSDEQFTQVTTSLIDELFASDLMKEAMIVTGEITEADYDKFQSELKTQIGTMLPQLKEMLKGSSAKVNYEFKDDSYTSNCELNLAVSVAEEKINVKATMSTESKKAAKKEIAIPADAKVYTNEEFQALIKPVAAYFDETDLVVKGNTVYVPLKDTMSQLDIPVKYDSKTKVTSVVIDGKETKVTTKIINGTSYITPATLQKLGFTYNQDANGYIVIQ